MMTTTVECEYAQDRRRDACTSNFVSGRQVVEALEKTTSSPEKIVEGLFETATSMDPPRTSQRIASTTVSE
jgi:hypothetical protein